MSTNVKVIVDQLSELVLSNSATTMYPGENKTVNVYTGNRGYKVTVDKESVVKATVDTEGRKMRFFMFLSNFIFPLMIFVIVGYGLLMKKDIYR